MNGIENYHLSDLKYLNYILRRYEYDIQTIFCRVKKYNYYIIYSA